MLTHEFKDATWYVVARHHPTEVLASYAFDLVQGKINMGSGDEAIGLYRLSPPVLSGGLRSGAPSGAHPLLAITLHEPTARKIEQLMAGHTWTPTPELIEALIRRRLHVLATTADEQRLIIRRDEGAELYPDGTMREHS